MDDPIDQLSDEQIDRYVRQLVLPEIGAGGQLKLLSSHMAIIGCGGLGASAALALAQAGIGQLDLYDPDPVSYTHLTLPINGTAAGIAVGAIQPDRRV